MIGIPTSRVRSSYKSARKQSQSTQNLGSHERNITFGSQEPSVSIADRVVPIESHSRNLASIPRLHVTVRAGRRLGTVNYFTNFSFVPSP